ncbi:MAG: tRNA (adenosine(37)-N6)-threonylcarbamoyltransferase complex transferase subunit TsaD [Calditrichaeota bacterium]|nr:MAG: tRNA (adenosine(37)-N6)-threonylcarbamoyltransferase complex transferase subunit TsaD [Calditrichota bacterium]
MLVLGIESSCDETSAAVIKDGREVLSNIILSQKEHTKFGGVVPEVASRVHLKTVVPIYEEALEAAKVTLDDIDLIAATMGPGLVGPLLVGLTFAKGLAFTKDIPFIGVNHMEGHLSANYLEHPDLNPHHISLVVSGGHTMLMEVKSFGEYTMLGNTIDDACGEAYDKVAKIMGLGYPGGAKLDKLAQKGKKDAIQFPRALLKEDSYRFSYSGLKTAVSLYIQKLSESELKEQLNDIAASFQEAAIEVLVIKTLKAAEDKNLNHISLSGGVAANSRLRSMFEERIGDNQKLFYPSIKLCTDNAAMIAAAGYFRFQKDGAGSLNANAVPYLKLAK